MFRFRLTLLMLLGGLVLLTVATIGIFSYLNARSAAQELSGQVLDQTVLRIDQQVDQLLDQATDQCSLTRQLLDSGQLQTQDVPRLVGYWKAALSTQPETTALFLGLAETGESVGVSRLQKDQLSVWHTTKAGAKYQLREYRAEDFPGKPFKTEPSEYDVRTRPWFQAAAGKGRGVWTPAYVFLGVGATQGSLGVSYAVPVPAADGKLHAVVMADFDLETLSRYLATLHIGQRGSAFLVEQTEHDEQSDHGDLRVIAHPRSELLILPPKPGQPGRRLSPVDELEDPAVQAFIHKLPVGVMTGGPADAQAIRFQANGENYLGSFRRIIGEARPPWLVCTYVPEDEVLAYAHRTSRLTFSISIGILGLAILISMFLARQVAHPLEQLAAAAADAGRLRLEPRPPIRSVVLEVDQLGKASEEMKSGLRSFEKYLPVDLVRGLLDSGQEALLGVEKRELTISFSDIVGFTSIAEAMPGEELVAHLGEYFDRLSRVVLESGGTVDKFIGDAIMAFWGAPTANPRHASAACLSAHRCRQRLRELAPEWEARGRPALRTRFGLNTGEVLVGNIGSPARMNYTVMGDAVNLASRLEGLNKYYGTEVLLSEATYREAKDILVVRPIDLVAVVGQTKAVPIYELLDLASEAPAAVRELADRYAAAFQAFQGRRWGESMAILTEILKAHPADAPAMAFLKRCQHYAENPPDAAWDGVNRMTSK
ncbi:adenylate/guanylate cyclase domain-containing protein [Limnoglobus roseus]|uniref:HAMP domain-containing protein n=1 Tax=Limnoglobus roseus TaxID=2598579 RepID=A0A5C1A8F2_9BACT|nr:adenylate/guanylate cyclase domain-containing protein [Limnoglobus roseus]QEL13414.1 HAMP domain-containing protein [Limnoglobus roseus]